MSVDDKELAKTTTLQLIRTSIRSRNLGRLKEAFERPFSSEFIHNSKLKNEPGKKKLFMMAVQEMKKEERQKAFQWTWDCYHPLMGPLGDALQELDQYVGHKEK